jgi:hypothetical protein
VADTNSERVRTYAPGLGVILFVFWLWLLVRSGALLRTSWWFIALCSALLALAWHGRRRRMNGRR